MKLSDKIVDALPLPEKGNKRYPDSGHKDAVKGFNVVITAKGARSFALRYRRQGVEKIYSYGGRPAWSTTAARKKALDLRYLVDQGGDPQAERQAERHQDTTGLFEARAREFLAHGRKKRGLPMRPATKKEYTRALLTYGIPLHGKALTEIRRGEVASLIRAVAGERGVVTAMRCRAALSRLYTWAIANGHAEVNPVTGTEGYSTPKRSRVLTDAELAAIWSATADPADFHLIVRMCLWTGCRRSEAGAMRWSELDQSSWTVDGMRTKNGRPLTLPLPRQAVTALAAWPRRAGRDLLFGLGGRGYEGWSDAKQRLDKASGVAGWALHDVRRTVETQLAGLGVLKEVANRVLNHAAGPITETYDHHDYARQKAAALQRWADALDRITGAAPAEVVQLRRAR